MAEVLVRGAAGLADGEKKVFKIRSSEILFVRHEGKLIALQPKCPHAGGPLAEGAICNGRLVCPWHMGTFSLPGGTLVEPPPMESLKTYAVREEDGRVFVDLTPHKNKPDAARTGKRKKLVFAGCGAAGAMALSTLALDNFSGEITVIDPVKEEPVDRTELTKEALSGKMPLARIKLPPPKLKLKRIVDSIIELDASRGKVRLKNGRRLKFDTALVATGGRPKRLDLPESDRVFTIRHPDDVRRIKARARKGSSAIIVGSSFIGMEAASALTQRGVKVTVAGADALPFAKQFGEKIAKAMLALHKRNGVKFLSGIRVKVASERLVVVEKNNRERRLAADLVLLGVGIAPALTFAHDLPLAKDSSIATDASLRAKGNVWVAGDIANVKGTRIEHWRLAQQHGMTAARQMQGGKEPYRGVPFFWTLHFDKKVNYLGHATEWDRIVIDGNVSRFKFLAFYLHRGQVKAVASCGRDTETAMLAELMRQPHSLPDLRRLLKRSQSGG